MKLVFKLSHLISLATIIFLYYNVQGRKAGCCKCTALASCCFCFPNMCGIGAKVKSESQSIDSNGSL